MLIDLRNLIKQKEPLTFYTSGVLGKAQIYGSYSSNTKVRVPTAKDYDIKIDSYQSSFKMDSILASLDKLYIRHDNEIYLRLLVVPERETKISI